MHNMSSTVTTYVKCKLHGKHSVLPVHRKNAHTKIVPVKKMKEFREEKKAQSLSYQPGPCADGGTDTCSSCMNEIGKRIYNSCPFGGKLLKKNY